MQYAKPVTLNVEECDRLSFLPYLFGLDFLYAEASVYALAKKMMPEYEGGFWHFIRLPDGGGYMMPDGDRFHLVIRPRSRQWWQLFRMVSQWHVDVVIVERRSFSIVAAVELDDASHLRPERRRRDILLEEVLRQAGIPLLRSHDARKLLQMTGEWLNTTGADQQSPEHRS